MHITEEFRADWVRSAIRQYEARLVRYAFQITGDVERSRDIVQETFIQLCDQYPVLSDDYVAQWLFRVCRNRAIDLLRKEGRMKPLDEAELRTHPSTEPSPAAQAQQSDEMSRAERWLAHLPPNQQEVIRLKFQNGLSYKEISHITNLTVTNVGVLIHTAIKTLREQMQREERVI